DHESRKESPRVVSIPARAGLATAQAASAAVFPRNKCNTRRGAMADHHTERVSADIAMHYVTRQCMSVLPVLLLLGCASAARQPVAVPSPAVAGGAGDTHLSARASARLVQQGYWVAKRDEQVVYCRVESVTGTMLSHTVCRSELQLRQQAESTQQSRDVLHQPLSPRCLGSVCAGADK
ncbi:MAG TPA: hypothetical protein VEY89_10585, partial [Candidatus Dormibacteraeota bacterium]|nr:hypothetical protein [Candidatus Dormibacteraeota bacterium]